MRLVLDITEGDDHRLKALVDKLNEERLVEGLDPATPEEVAAAMLNRAVLNDYRAEFGANLKTA